MKRKIVLTGGGSAGHVTVNLALIPKLREADWEITYIGSVNGIERELVSGVEGVDYKSISTGKLRRYFDWNNFKDPFKVVKGIWEAYRIIKKVKPDVVFSKGGFVSVPVVLGAKLNGVPTIIHESDITPGLANKLSIPFVTKVCTTFPETAKALPEAKTIYLGAVIREELFKGDAAKGRQFTDFTRTKPVLLIMGGSLGARKINQAVRENLDDLLKDFQIVHLCGKGNVDASLSRRGYQQYDYIKEELPDLLAMADVIISRAGSNAIFEFKALKKPMLLIPLSQNASRGDQVLNAESFKKSGFADVLLEEDLNPETFLEKVMTIYANREAYQKKMAEDQGESPLQKLYQLIETMSQSS
ncbi:undecaprenyldiphospho-muramoylpentapeptide beta-N-acetylglucosaminyltransferase [Pullulanibacillus sp. KACC 23026]|uniref:undecaprenyldiphospho-muramoylpentapeptide beta-N-acetylglucosaminyltransferase n=1 Tax=Pullulanibacillus sp. KACC 23026 TaxID=3028315 RepID=UPI0023B0583E|nr:undecaprenyldiphospho-muramoylpentapeptide beta-N-acetylglucosaminyltransferase [Pullulanibacillus sp. KACC 23026]WEG13072.1 undecaprenyldiphospho-muramoylpentapeptide beta-N-acetylglucosaminyltransferase [Pullulanibacillus sp. KACC 23026]